MATDCTVTLQEHSLFSTCCKREIDVQIVSNDGEKLEPDVLQSTQSSKLRWKRSNIQGRKSSIPIKTGRKMVTWLSKQFTYTMHTTLKPIEYLQKA